MVVFLQEAFTSPVLLPALLGTGVFVSFKLLIIWADYREKNQQQ